MVTYIQSDLFTNLLLKISGFVVLHKQLSFKLLSVCGNFISMELHVFRMHLSLPVQFLLESLLSLSVCSCLDRVGVLDYSEVVLWSNIRRIKQMLDDSVHVVGIFIGGTFSFGQCTTDFTSFCCRFGLLLVREEALKVITKLRIYLCFLSLSCV